jgi:hypothetical protein
MTLYREGQFTIIHSRKPLNWADGVPLQSTPEYLVGIDSSCMAPMQKVVGVGSIPQTRPSKTAFEIN